MMCPFCGSLKTEEHEEDGIWFCIECYEIFHDDYREVKMKNKKRRG